MRIGIFTDTYYPEVNGVANSSYVLKRALESLGHKVFIFTSQAGVKKKEKGVFRIKSVKPALVKDRNLALPLEPYWRKKGKELGLDIIHTQTEFTMGFLGKRLANYLGIPHVHTYHTMYEDYTHYLKVPGNAKLKPIIGTLTRKFCDQADRIIVPTKKVQEKLLEYKICRGIDIIPTGLEIEKYQSADEEKVEDLKKRYKLKDKKVFIYIGRLAKEKNIDEVVRYFSTFCKQTENFQLMIVGDGPVMKSLKDQVTQLGLKEKVTFTGVVPWDEIQNYYALGNIFVSASTSETQGLTYNEALASGLPILVRKDPCLQEVLKEGENGMGFESEEEFIKGTERILTFKNETIQAYSSMDFAKKVQEVYREEINKVKKISYLA